jgi:hypothetical protein
MKIQIDNRSVDVLDALCQFRPCLWPGEWKGVLTPGVGYRYAPESDRYWHCFRRADRGCPYPLPDPDPMKARCCDTPRVRKVKPDPWGRPPKRQRCQTCGAWLSGFALELAREAI